MKSSPLFSGLMYAGLFMLVGTLLASLIMLGTNVPESSWLSSALFIHGVAMFIGGISSGKRGGSKGWYHGGLLGIVYAVIVWIIGFLAYDAGLTKELMYLTGVAFAAGALGGMIGVNMKK
ncbi:TIGR04086 family membrane protein [Paenibacillus allorhizosphaerae]|uniref:TIGR04086 family membrane protein n=1 Tax=Paenibacillus allorhizosphaerae TaxID=2849866 RepID=A0ABM8VRF8_9BACL|nr:TIGR04086 family membrane protein [Paenibacillus allorhizosphaerae]CAG7655230.1 hypothetical protein PAECIP111802_06049 [Paenibacillus allorhizosphaerae]